MSEEVLQEELQVLESIYPTEFTKLSETEIQFNVETEEPVEGGEDLKLLLKVVFPDSYPDTLPELFIEPTEGDLEESELDYLIQQLRTVGEENLGMAMTFTLVSHLREQLLALIRLRLERKQREESEKERIAIEAEETRTKGTAVTLESFKMWKAKFDKEMNRRKAQDEEDRLKGLSPKDREEFKKLQTRLSGRQLFERNRDLAIAEDASLIEEGTESVDISQYERVNEREEDEVSERLEFSDSD